MIDVKDQDFTCVVNLLLFLLLKLSGKFLITQKVDSMVRVQVVTEKMVKMIAIAEQTLRCSNLVVPLVIVGVG